jgi:hypothetical protein
MEHNRKHKKRVIVEFEVDQDLTLAELCDPLHAALRTARYQVDEDLNRMGSGRPAALHSTTIRFIEFETNNITYKDGIMQPIRRHC